MQVEDDNNYWDNGSGRRIRKAPASSEPGLPDAKRQMSTNSPPSAMEISVMPQDVPAMASADDVLVQMIRQSGAQTYAEVVEFCRSTGIPLSRMLLLDLMRQLPAVQRDWNNSLRGDASGHNKGN